LEKYQSVQLLTQCPSCADLQVNEGIISYTKPWRTWSRFWAATTAAELQAWGRARPRLPGTPPRLQPGTAAAGAEGKTLTCNEIVTLQYKQSTELQPAIAISNPARAGAAAGPQFELQYQKFFDIDI
jgi:hypothetical protein